MSETERKTEDNESSSDEEPPPGELDKPIVILYNKRAKKVCHLQATAFIGLDLAVYSNVTRVANRPKFSLVLVPFLVPWH